VLHWRYCRNPTATGIATAFTMGFERYKWKHYDLSKSRDTPSEWASARFTIFNGIGLFELNSYYISHIFTKYMKFNLLK
jgi:hypothetical protein